MPPRPTTLTIEWRTIVADRDVRPILTACWARGTAYPLSEARSATASASSSSGSRS